MRKPKVETFLFPRKTDRYPGTVDATDCVPFPPKFLKTRSGGTIIVFQTRSLVKAMGVVVGWMLSRPQKARGRDVMTVKVRPLTTEERQNYKDRFRKVLEGHIAYW